MKSLHLLKLLNSHLLQIYYFNAYTSMTIAREVFTNVSHIATVSEHTSI